MAISVQMPALGESVTEGTVTRWLKQEGDTVEQDEPLLEVSTDKVDTEIPSPGAGVLKKIIAQEDDTVEVGGELAVIGEAGESDGEQPAAAEAPPAEEEKPAEEPAAQPEAVLVLELRVVVLGEEVVVAEHDRGHAAARVGRRGARRRGWRRRRGRRRRWNR